jgi:hypothetical protein
MPDGYETDTTRAWSRDAAEQAPHVSDAPHISPAMPGEAVAQTWRSRLSWGAVLAGVVVALVTQLVLNLIGIAFGAGSLAPLSGGSSPAAISTGAGIWFALSSILSGLAGGYAAGMFSGARNESSGGWHGLTTWALTALLLSYLLTSAAAGLMGGLGSVAKQTGAATLAGSGAAQMADPFSAIENQLRSATSGNDPAALRDAAIAAVKFAVTAAVTGDSLHAGEASERAAQDLARAENIPVETARTQVQGYEQQYRQTVDAARTRARQAADEAGKAVSRAALLGALSLLLGGLAGWLGGRMAAADRTFGERVATASGRARR